MRSRSRHWSNKWRRWTKISVVFNCTSSPEVLTFQDPARLDWKPLSKIEQYQVGLSDLLKTNL